MPLHPISGCDQPLRRADVVFIHGLGGDAFTTWRHGEDETTSWPHWLGKAFPEVGVWSLGYAASPSKWQRRLSWGSGGNRDAGHTMALPDRALNVLDEMVQRGLGERPLFFICHSLGGLVAKKILHIACDPLQTKYNKISTHTCAVLFLATPHQGAALATLADTFRVVFGATVTMEDLREHDAHLRELYNWYRRHAPVAGIRTETYYETRAVKGVAVIVNPTSANPGAGEDPVPLDEDHLSIAKPRKLDDPVCAAASSLLRNCVLATKPRPDAAPVLAGDIRIPHELPPAAEKLFGRRTELHRLIERLRAHKNTAVAGPAGMGKTALAAQALLAVVGETPASLAASPFPDGVVYLDFYSFRGKAEAAWNSLAAKLEGAGFMESSPAHVRAAEACRARRILVVIEGGEEADGRDGRASFAEFESVLSPQNRWLLLTRLSTQADPAETVELRTTLDREDAAGLLDELTGGRLDTALRERALELLDGHPLALTWAGNLLARGDEDPGQLLDDWAADPLLTLTDPSKANHTLEWLFGRSIRGLDATAREALAAAALLAHAPFPLAAIAAALGGPDGRSVREVRESLKALVLSNLLRRPGEADQWQFAHVLGYRFSRKETGSDPALREHLGEWLHGHLKAELAGGTAGNGQGSLARDLAHLAALLRADDDQRLWLPLANYALYDLYDRLTDLGRLPMVSAALGAVAGWLDRFPGEKARQPKWLREHAALFNRQGNLLSAQGVLAGALASYVKMLDASQRLAEFDPSNTDWQRNLSVSQEKMGNLLSAQGVLAGALASYGKALEVRRRLAESDPSNAGWQRDLSVSHCMMGDVLSDQGDLAGALASYGKTLEVSRRLAESDPSNTGWQRDLSVSQERMGDVLRAQGDLAGALAAYGKALEVRRRLAEADTSNAGWQRDLSVSHNKMGDVLRAQGDPAGALASFGKDLEISRRLAESDPSNAGWQRDLSVSHNKIGDVLSAQGDLAGALASYGKALEVRRRLAEADPSNAGWQRDLSYSLTMMAQVNEKLGNRAEALPFARESLAIGERLSALDLTNATWQNDVAFSQALVARLEG